MNKVFLIIAFLMIIKPITPVVEYYFNYDYISKVLCENKDKPSLKCCGKCHLKKELAKASEGDKPNSTDKKNNSKQEIEIYLNEMLEYNFGLKNIEVKQNDEYYSNCYSYLTISPTFHPPSFS